MSQCSCCCAIHFNSESWKQHRAKLAVVEIFFFFEHDSLFPRRPEMPSQEEDVAGVKSKVHREEIRLVFCWEKRQRRRGQE